jgi:hypothetical protein
LEKQKSSQPFGSPSASFCLEVIFHFVAEKAKRKKSKFKVEKLQLKYAGEKNEKKL